MYIFDIYIISDIYILVNPAIHEISPKFIFRCCSILTKLYMSSIYNIRISIQHIIYRHILLSALSEAYSEYLREYIKTEDICREDSLLTSINTII